MKTSATVRNASKYPPCVPAFEPTFTTISIFDPALKKNPLFEFQFNLINKLKKNDGQQWPEQLGKITLSILQEHILIHSD